GYAFGGWTDGTNVYGAGSAFTMGASDVTLTAVWEENALEPTNQVGTSTIVRTAGAVIATIAVVLIAVFYGRKGTS
ncbi:MAG: hypothetical protein PWR17_1278, partial [Candidatus Methanomethylophilaceae archaeon]|nr:hypothetical protein [Candidatus Methanomethylophilaceae archaeon]